MDRRLQTASRRHNQHAFVSGLRGAAPKPAEGCDPGLRWDAVDAGAVEFDRHGVTISMAATEARSLPLAGEGRGGGHSESVRLRATPPAPPRAPPPGGPHAPQG